MDLISRGERFQVVGVTGSEDTGSVRQHLLGQMSVSPWQFMEVAANKDRVQSKPPSQARLWQRKVLSMLVFLRPNT